MAENKTQIRKTGRRKTSISQVIVSSGTGKITLNCKKIENYFKGCERFIDTALSAIKAVNASGNYDYKIKVKGGGPSSQAGAILHATARALAETNPENKKTLKKKGYLTRDDRMVERKKPGRPKARKKFQYSKR